MSSDTEAEHNSINESRAYRWIELVTATVLVVAMVIVLSLQVFFRYVVRAPLYWSEELARFLLIWAVFAGATFAFRHDTHMNIDLLVHILPKRVLAHIDTVVRLVMTVFFLMIAAISWNFVGRYMDIKSPAMELSLGIVYIILPLTSIANIAAVWLKKFRA